MSYIHNIMILYIKSLFLYSGPRLPAPDGKGDGIGEPGERAGWMESGVEREGVGGGVLEERRMGRGRYWIGHGEGGMLLNLRCCGGSRTQSISTNNF